MNARDRWHPRRRIIGCAGTNSSRARIGDRHHLLPRSAESLRDGLLTIVLIGVPWNRKLETRNPKLSNFQTFKLSNSQTLKPSNLPISACGGRFSALVDFPEFFSIFRLRGARGFDTLCTRSPPRGKPRTASRSLRDAKVQKNADPTSAPGGAAEGTRSDSRERRSRLVRRTHQAKSLFF